MRVPVVSLVVTLVACGRFGFDAARDGVDAAPRDVAIDQRMGDAPFMDAPAVTGIAHVKTFAEHTLANANNDSFANAAAAAGNAILLHASCQEVSLPTAVTITAPGWTVTQLSPINSQNGLNGASFGAIAPNATMATFAVHWQFAGATVCGRVHEVGDEFSGVDPTGGVTTFDAVGSGTGAGNCAAPVTTKNANDAVWTGCTGTSISGVGGGFTKGADDLANAWGAYIIPNAQGTVTETPTFTNTGAYVITGVSFKAM